MTTEQLTAGTLADSLGAVLDGPSDLVCSGVSSIADAKDGDITFMVDTNYAASWEESKASIGIVQSGIDVPNHDPSIRALLRVDDAELAIAYVLSLFMPEGDLPEVGVHPNAVVSPSALLGEEVRIGPFVCIADDAVIGDRTSIYSNVRIGRACCIGADTVLHAGVAIEYNCCVGSNCILHSNVSIGADGFGFRPSEDQSRLVKMPHIGNAELGDHVEIGSNSCVDRGKFATTKIGDGTKLDNLVQIGHNCQIGKHCVIAATTGIGGSVQVGDWVQIGANVGIAPHCIIGNGARIGSKSGVMHNIPEGEEWLGLPAGRLRDVLRQWASVRKLPRIIAQFGRSDDS
jgi:UDP-3-O-[3-hydroxymyristoyl] glucosamine N-acyltransferase